MEDKDRFGGDTHLWDIAINLAKINIDVSHLNTDMDSGTLIKYIDENTEHPTLEH